jgi:methoxymalonate biosynthesis acyl carrier protein
MKLEEAVRKINTYLSSNKSNLSFGESDNLFDIGVIDSFGLIELVLFIEKEFSISIEIENLSEDNFSNVLSISNHIYQIINNEEAKKNYEQGLG